MNNHDMADQLARRIRNVLGEFNDDDRGVETLVRELAEHRRARITQPTQAVDVVKVQAVIGGLRVAERLTTDALQKHQCAMVADELTKAIASNPAVEQAGCRVPDAKPRSEYHEDHGDVVWWSWDAERTEWRGEPAWIGQPDDSDWPGYHTHYTPHPTFPAAPPAKQGEA